MKHRQSLIGRHETRPTEEGAIDQPSARDMVLETDGGTGLGTSHETGSAGPLQTGTEADRGIAGGTSRERGDEIDRGTTSVTEQRRETNRRTNTKGDIVRAQKNDGLGRSRPANVDRVHHCRIALANQERDLHRRLHLHLRSGAGELTLPRARDHRIRGQRNPYRRRKCLSVG